VNAADAMRYLADRGLRVPSFDDVDRFTGLPFPVTALISEEMTGDESLAVWHAARSHTRRTGLVPVLIGAEPMIEWFNGEWGSVLIERISAFREASKADPHLIRAALEARLAERFSAQVIERLRGEMAAVRPAWLVRCGRSCIAPRDPGFGPVDMDAQRFLSDEEPVRCVLLGCRPHEVPVYLGLGGWNGSPEPHEQAMLLKGFGQRHGTQIVHIGRGAVEMYSPRPPARIDELRVLLWEAFLYCFDAAFQDEDSTFRHLRGMLSQEWWCFSWD
jgi:hypothetical protein